ncbi:MAG TPA: hypothetical protein VKD21_15035 [Acidimicrobiales bacterium]|nr:hypothetical protein [Acidimicrobiales bacterium]
MLEARVDRQGGVGGRHRGQLDAEEVDLGDGRGAHAGQVADEHRRPAGPVRRCLRGRARRTSTPPTLAARLGTSSTTGPSGWPGSATSGAASVAATGPLIDPSFAVPGCRGEPQAGGPFTPALGAGPRG